MKRLVVAVFVFLLAATVSLATPLCGGSQNVLVPGFTCEIGGLVFSNFDVVNAGNVPIDTMNLVTANIANGYVNLNFNPNLGAPTHAADVWFYFTVTGPVNGVDLTVGGNNAGVTERICSTIIDVNGNICTGGTANQLAVMNAFSGTQVFASFPDNISVSPTYVFKDILVQTGGELSSISQSFHSIPEPVSLLMIGGGLLALGFFRRRTI